MSVEGVGIDVVDVPRFSKSCSSAAPGSLDRLFTEGERRDAHDRPERLAARFAAKEAVLKTFGVGLGSTPWRSIEVQLNEAGAPSVLLHAPATELAKAAGVDDAAHLAHPHRRSGDGLRRGLLGRGRRD